MFYHSAVFNANAHRRHECYLGRFPASVTFRHDIPSGYMYYSSQALVDVFGLKTLEEWDVKSFYPKFRLAYLNRISTMYILNTYKSMLIILQRVLGPPDAFPAAAPRTEREAADGAQERDHAPHRHDGHRHRRLRPRGGRSLCSRFPTTSYMDHQI